MLAVGAQIFVHCVYRNHARIIFGLVTLNNASVYWANVKLYSLTHSLGLGLVVC